MLCCAVLTCTVVQFSRFATHTSGCYFAGGKSVILAHVRRWKSDAVFFKQLRKQFDVVDITADIQLDAAQFSSHTRGASRLFMLHHK